MKKYLIFLFLISAFKLQGQIKHEVGIGLGRFGKIESQYQQHTIWILEMPFKQNRIEPLYFDCPVGTVYSHEKWTKTPTFYYTISFAKKWATRLQMNFQQKK
jgi:hypothetical protein